MDSTIAVAELADDTQIASLLEGDRPWTAYALCDLEPPYRADARYLGALRHGRLIALVLIYSPPGFTALLPCGDPTGVTAILVHARDLPRSTVLLVQPALLPALQTRYHLGSGWTMLRMVLTAATFCPAPATGAAIVRLSTADLPALQRLYALHADSVFTPFMLQHGVYYGAVQDGNLVAVAGTHARSPRYRVAAIGNVFTHPDHRGRGLATAVTGAVASALMDEGATLVALNVRQDNAPAIAAYQHVGFCLHELFWEGAATLR